MKTIGRKIIMSFVSLIALFVFMSVVVTVKVNETERLSERIQHDLAPSIDANLRLSNSINRSVSSLQSWLLLKDVKYIQQRKAMMSVVEKNHQRLVNQSIKWQDDRQVYQLNRVTELLVKLEQQQLAIERLMLDGNTTDAVFQFQDINSTLVVEITAALKRIIEPQTWEMSRLYTKKAHSNDELKQASYGILAVSVLFGGALGVILMRAVIIPLNRTINRAHDVASGHYDITNDKPTGDIQLDTALYKMTTALDRSFHRIEQQKNKLEQTNYALAQSNDELSQFAYRISHDLKAPLVTINGLSKVITEDLYSKDYEEINSNVGRITEHAGKLIDLIADIMSLTKAELKNESSEPVQLFKVVDDIALKLEAIHIGHNVRVENKIAPDLIVNLSRVRLNQILENLISNAIKYQNKQNAISLVSIHGTQQEDKVELVVSDNGLGIPAQMQDKVFNMFQRFHPKISMGSGLGLYIIKKHVEKLKGNIDFVSTESGTSFTLTLPLPKGI